MRRSLQHERSLSPGIDVQQGVSCVSQAIPSFPDPYRSTMMSPLARILAGILAFTLALPALAFSFDDVASRAQKLAAKPYERPDTKLPKPLADLNYEQYRDIRFKPEHALWRKSKLPFEVQFFHPGIYFNQTVQVNLVSAEGVRKLPFAPEYFDYGRNKLDPEKMRDVGYAGLRVHYPLNEPDQKDEIIVFQGASYFRGLGRGQHYGLSARGLAIDTGELAGEEFPAFTEFWLEWPRAEDQQLTIYALLDSRRLTGAYQFKIRPGDSTATDVKLRLFFRENVGKLGIAPLTSMFLYGENQAAPIEDYRPEVHDSDGLQVRTDQEWIWRPLVNPRRLLITSFGTSNPRGFGLMQRDRAFSSYEDLDARYDVRPNAWIEPRGDWGRGRVELVQIPTPNETNDNVVAYWVPEKSPEAGQQLDLEYALRWEMKFPTNPPVARVVQTRRGKGWQREPDGTIRFQIDFEGGALERLLPDVRPVAGVWINDNGELLDRQTVRNDVTGGWRVSLRIRRLDDSKPVEMRTVLRNGDDSVSETWAYVMPPDAR
jgi:glucans biosynthesis protein